MPEDDKPKYLGKLSPSANAILGVMRALEDGGQLDLFQEDPELERLRIIVSSFRGSLYSALVKRLNEVVSLGGVSVITQRDMMSLLEILWAKNVSRFSDTELAVLRGTLENLGLSMAELSSMTGLSYAQTRRGALRLRQSGVLRIKGTLSMAQLGLERILVTMEAPSMILSGPYVKSHLFIDSDGPHVFQVLAIPSANVGELRNVVRNLHSTSRNVVAWRMSRGTPRFNGLYSGNRWWQVDLLHYRLMLRAGGAPITIGDFPLRSMIPACHFAASELKIVDQLLENYETTAHGIVGATGLSPSTAFRKRAGLISRGIVKPRAKVSIPALTDRVLAVASPNVAGNIMPAWNQLPLSYVSLMENIENRSERKMILTAAVPAGQGRELIQVMNEERSRVDDYAVHLVSRGNEASFKTASLYDRRRSIWKWRLEFFDLLAYSVGRRNTESGTEIPLDLA